MTTAEALAIATERLMELRGHTFDVLGVTKPVSPEAALNLAKVISKLSPLLGSLIEFNTIEVLNEKEEFREHGEWIRQDPGFPDTIFQGAISPVPGFEIKAWFPLATELTARFKDSQNHFAENNTNVAILAWLPEKLIFGRPRIIGVCVASGQSVARSRDEHYHNPPDYVVLEPEDTKARTRNLQQTNTSGHKWQGTPEQFKEAEALVASWGDDGKRYKATPEYQAQLRQLMSAYNYRLDTNYSKIDRIVHPEIEKFKTEIYGTNVEGMTVQQWLRLFAKPGGKNETPAYERAVVKRDIAIKEALLTHLGIKEEDAEKLIK